MTQAQARHRTHHRILYLVRMSDSDEETPSGVTATPTGLPPAPATAAVRALASEVVDEIAQLGSTLKQPSGQVNLDEVASQARRIAGQAAGLPAEFSRAANALTQDFRSSAAKFARTVPTPSEVAATVYAAQVPKIVVESPLLFGLFVPPPQWPPPVQSVQNVLRSASIPAALVGGLLAFCIFVWCLALLALPLIMPLLVLLAP